MAATALYQPGQRWRIWLAFGGAALIHLGAIAIAANRSSDLPLAAVPDSDTVVDLVTTPENPPSFVIPDAPPLPPPPVQSDEPEFAQPTPPPAPLRKRSERPVQPLVRPTAPGVPRPTNMRLARVLALAAPRPEYPYEARRQRTTGSGVAVLIIEPATGDVVDVSMESSTGSPVLDNAALAAFRRWRFKPGTVSKVRIPITYTLTGASY